MSSLQDILKLSIAERLLLLEQIWNSIPTDEISITKAQKKELDKRLARLKNGETTFFTWNEIRKNLKK